MTESSTDLTVRNQMNDTALYYQLVVRIFKGRRFPKHLDEGGKFIAFEGRFNGESLTTDPKPLSESPVFNTELVWEFGQRKQRELKQADNSVLKLRCVLAGDVGSTGAKLIGFVLLDLRTAACAVQSYQSKLPVCSGNHCVQEGSWLPLRGSRQPLPEVKIFYKIDCKMLVDSGLMGTQGEFGFPTELLAINAPVTQDANDRTKDKADLKCEKETRHLECQRRVVEPLILHPERVINSGIFKTLILSDDLDARKYMLTLEFQFLRLKSDSKMQFGTESMSLLVGFAGRFELNIIAQSQYVSCDPCTFRFDERPLIQYISASPSLLEDFVKAHSVRLWLLAGNSMIANGSCQINAALPQNPSGGNDRIKLFSTLSTSDFKSVEIATLEFRYKLEETSMSIHHSPDARKKSQIYMTLISLQVPNDTKAAQVDEPEFQICCNYHGSNLLSSERFSLSCANHIAIAQSFCIDALSDSVEPGDFSFTLELYPANKVQQIYCASCLNSLCPAHPGCIGRLERQMGGERWTFPSALEYYDASRGLRKFSLVIDLREVRNFRNTQQTVYIRYSLPNLGFNPPILTKPPVDIVRHSNAVLTNGFSKFDFELDPEGVAECFSDPVQIELWNKTSFANDQLVALGDLNLWALFSQDVISNWQGTSKWGGEVRLFEVDEQSAKEVLSKGIGAVQVQCTDRALFLVRVKLELFDFGLVRQSHVFHHTTKVTPDPSHATCVPVEPAGEVTCAFKSQNLTIKPARTRSRARNFKRDETEDGVTRDKSILSTAEESEEANVHHSKRVEAQSSSTRRENGSHHEDNSQLKGRGTANANISLQALGMAKQNRINPLDLEEIKKEKIASFESEFRKHECIRQSAIKKKLEDLAGLERTLKKGLIELEARERRLALSEEEAEMRQRSANSLLDQRRTELQEARRRMREEVAHDMNMAEAKRKDLSDQLMTLQVRLKESEERNSRLDVELQKLKNVKIQLFLPVFGL
eukprot:768500-Hanusia_phi.AAC.4